MKKSVPHRRGAPTRLSGSSRGAARFAAVLIVVCAFFAGWSIKSLVRVPSGLLRVGDRWVLDVALPILVVSKMSRISIDSTLGVPVVAAWTVMGICVVVVTVSGRRWAWSERTVGALLLVGVLGNTSFLGLGLVEGLLGADHLAPALAYDQLGTFLALATYGSFVSSRFGAGEWNWRSVATRLIRFMPFVALVVSVPLRSVDVSDQVYAWADQVGRTVAPVAMCLLGLRFTLRVDRRVLVPAGVGLVVKMLIAPTVVFCAAIVAGDAGSVPWSASVLQAAMPPMVTAGVVAIGAGLDEDVVAFMVGVGTLASLVSVPLLSLIAR